MDPFFSFLNNAAEQAFAAHGADHPADVTLSIMNAVALHRETEDKSVEWVRNVLQWPEVIDAHLLQRVFTAAKRLGREPTAAERWIEQLIASETRPQTKIGYVGSDADTILGIVLERGNLSVAKATANSVERDLMSWSSKPAFLFVSAVKSGNIACLDWLLQKFGKCDNVGELFNWAAALSDTDVLQWIHVRFPHIDSRPEVLGRAFNAAASAGRVPTMQWFKDTYGPGLNIHHNEELAFRSAISNGRIAAAQWLLSNAGDKLQPHIKGEEAFRGAAKNGHVEAMQWMKNTFPDTLNVRVRSDEVFRTAIQDKRDAVVQWYREQYPALAPAPPKRKDEEPVAAKKKKSKRK